MHVQIGRKIGADIVLGTDPDSDRIGIAVRDDKVSMKLLNGNQTMVVMTNFLINQWKDQGKSLKMNLLVHYRLNKYGK